MKQEENKNLLANIFSVIQTLEKRLEQSREMLAVAPKTADEEAMLKSLDEQSRIVAHMRRVANKLQLELASSNWTATVRSLRIFYGLHHMVRPEILQTVSRTLKSPSPPKLSSPTQSNVIH